MSLTRMIIMQQRDMTMNQTRFENLSLIFNIRSSPGMIFDLFEYCATALDISIIVSSKITYYVRNSKKEGIMYGQRKNSFCVLMKIKNNTDGVDIIRF